MVTCGHMDTLKNAFTAFGGTAEDATIDTLRADLALALRKFIENSQLGQAKAGEILGLKQNVVSQIVRGRIGHLSVERLIKAMVRAKIAGYAEWGASPENASAGAGVRSHVATQTSLAIAPPVGTIYPEKWLGQDPKSAFGSRWRVRSPIGR